MAFTINHKDFKDQGDFTRKGRGCATSIPTPIQIARVDDEILKNRRNRLSFSQLTIPIKFHHLCYGSSGLITKVQRDQQVEILNGAYSNYGIKFAYDEGDVTFTNNYNWYYMGHRSFSEREAKSSLSVDPNKCLNFYTGGLQPGLLGWATFPFDLAGDPVMDGVVVLDESLPGGNAAPFNLGNTAVHEVGHWLGLYHTFQDGCTGFGDHCNDTVAHSSPNYGKPPKGERHGACKEDEFAPIHNFMNYVDDEWMTEFTPEQGERIKSQIMMYRTGLVEARENLLKEQT
ncbi:MAG TPA: zinc metalloprotease [Cyclobacteriaceae bacterium]|nr:zinc metalloprotease [Cyclobacteriaceae bacterium]